MVATQNSSAGNVLIKDKLVRNTSDDDNDEEIDAELEALEKDFLDTEIAVEKIKIIENFSMSAKMALESSLLMNSSATTSSAPLKKNKHRMDSSLPKYLHIIINKWARIYRITPLDKE